MSLSLDLEYVLHFAFSDAVLLLVKADTRIEVLDPSLKFVADVNADCRL